MGRNISTESELLGNLELKKNTKKNGYVGVTRQKNGKCRARLTAGGKTKCLGTFDSSPEAAAAVASAHAMGVAALHSPRVYRKSAAPPRLPRPRRLLA